MSHRMRKVKVLLIIFSTLTIVTGITTVYHGYQVLSNWDNGTTVNINTLMVLMMTSLSFSIITVYLQRMQ
jgi:hypothetical protein